MRSPVYLLANPFGLFFVLKQCRQCGANELGSTRLCFLVWLKVWLIQRKSLFCPPFVMLGNFKMWTFFVATLLPWHMDFSSCLLMLRQPFSCIDFTRLEPVFSRTACYVISLGHFRFLPTMLRFSFVCSLLGIKGSHPRCRIVWTLRVCLGLMFAPLADILPNFLCPCKRCIDLDFREVPSQQMSTAIGPRQVPIHVNGVAVKTPFAIATGTVRRQPTFENNMLLQWPPLHISSPML